MTDAFWLVSSASTDSWVRSVYWQIVGSVPYIPGAMGDQETMLAVWSDDSQMEECDAGAPLTVQTSSARNPDCTHDDFAHKLKVQILPNDQEKQGEFDVGVDFRIGDPNVNFRAAAAKSYETIEEVGKPDWNLLFGFILTRMLPCVMWFSSLSAKPVAFTWSTIHGLAHSSWQPSAWSSLVYT